MLCSILFSTVLGMATPAALAGELDNEGSVINQGLHGTVVIRVDQRDGSVSVAQLSEVPEGETAAQQAALGAEFTGLGQNQLRSELDQDAGASSWYWYTNPYSYNHLGWYGYRYNHYYSYSYSYYSYYYYSSYAWGRYWYW